MKRGLHEPRASRRPHMEASVNSALPSSSPSSPLPLKHTHPTLTPPPHPEGGGCKKTIFLSGSKILLAERETDEQEKTPTFIIHMDTQGPWECDPKTHWAAEACWCAVLDKGAGGRGLGFQWGRRHFPGRGRKASAWQRNSCRATQKGWGGGNPPSRFLRDLPSAALDSDGLRWRRPSVGIPPGRRGEAQSSF